MAMAMAITVYTPPWLPGEMPDGDDRQQWRGLDRRIFVP